MADLNKKILIVGCGLSGAVCAQELANKGFNIEILEKRNHIAGNLYDYVDRYGITIHKYGPHTFHTNKKNIFEYIKKFYQWDKYKVFCGAKILNKCTPTPFNFKTIDDYFSKEKAKIIKKAFLEKYQEGSTVSVLDVINSDNIYIKEFGKFVFEHDYRPYTAKQWGLDPEKIDPSILVRVPIRVGYEEGYFTDPIEVMPHGLYTEFIKNLLDNNRISVKLNTDALDFLSIDKNKIRVKGLNYEPIVIYTGPVDELFKYVHGNLPYRSLRFVVKHFERDSFQDYSIVACPESKKFTRIVEYKKMYHTKVFGTSVVYEYPEEYKLNTNEPYYPLLKSDSIALYNKYKELASSINNLFLCGRLACYKYFNMDQTIENALKTVQGIN